MFLLSYSGWEHQQSNLFDDILDSQTWLAFQDDQYGDESEDIDCVNAAYYLTMVWHLNTIVHTVDVWFSGDSWPFSLGDGLCDR